ncbi:MAG: P-loop NTPase [Simkaniaceae bacterium]|nr:P-loop NTPase [Simkaniaceae bacterium]
MKKIAIASGKGGVGKSTVTVNLARSLLKKGFKVGIIDADVYGPSIPHLLKEDRLPEQRGDKVVAANCEGIKVISVAYFRQGHSAAIVRAPIANGIITQFIDQVIWGDLDYLLIDLPPGTGDVHLTLMQNLELSGGLVVTTPQELALLDVRKAVELFVRMNVEVLGVIENMSYYITSGNRIEIFGSGGGERLCSEWGLELLAQIPLDPQIASFEKSEVWEAIDLECQEARSLPVELVEAGRFALVEEKKISARDLQRGCPCMACQMNREKSQGEVQFTAFRPVGRYGVKFQFNQGCSRGIYTFEYMREF